MSSLTQSPLALLLRRTSPHTALRSFPGRRAFPRCKSTAQPPHHHPPPPPTTNVQATKTTTRFDRFIARTPTRFLRTRLTALKTAPLTHIISFLLLHEITAVVPLFGLAGAFHYYHWLPPYFAEGAWVLKGVNMFGNYFKRKGWITGREAGEARDAAQEGRESVEEVEKESGKRAVLGKWWDRGEGGTRIVIEFATAYAVVKALLPLRIMVSIWGAPWFARWTVIPVQNSVKRWVGRK